MIQFPMIPPISPQINDAESNNHFELMINPFYMRREDKH